MHSGGYKKFLTILMIIIILAVIGLLGYIGYDFLVNYLAQKDAEEAVEEFEQQFENVQEEQVNQEHDRRLLYLCICLLRF